MNDLKIILYYEFKIKFREIKSIIKNLFIGLIIMGIIFMIIFFQFYKMISLNLYAINLHINQIVLVISIVIFIFSLIYKKIPLKWHPASMIYLSGDKFRKFFKFSLFKKIILYIVLAFVLALALNRFRIDLRTIQVFLIFWNLFIISLISRYFIYNKGLDTKIIGLLLTYTIALNIQLYINKNLSIILMLFLSYISTYAMRELLNIKFNLDKSFTDMSLINRANYLSRGNSIENAQVFVRETSAEKNRGNFIFKNIRFKNPLLEKNLITFSRINFFVSFYILAIFIVTIILYKLEPFEFIKRIKDLGLPIVALHQASFINNIIDLIADQKKLLVMKSKEGLYLPYKRYEINKSFMFLGFPILLLETLVVGLIFNKSIWAIGFVLLLYLITFFIYLSFDKNRGRDFLEKVVYFIVFMVSYLLVT